MWVCQKCNQIYTNNKAITCWKCGTDRPILKRKSIKNEDVTVVARKKRRVVKYEIIQGTFSSWDSVAAKAAKILTIIPKEKLLSISHSAGDNGRNIIIFYEI